MTKLVHNGHYTLSYVLNGHKGLYTSYGINVEARAKKLRARGATDLRVRRFDHPKSDWKVLE